MILFRAIIESQIAYLAAERATTEHIENLRNYFNQMKNYCYDVQKITYYDIQFHMELASASCNNLLQRLMLMSCDVFASGVYQAFSVDTNQNVKQALDSHEKILLAVEQHDRNNARTAMFQHINIIQGRGLALVEQK